MVLFAEQPVDPLHIAIARKLIDELTARTLGGRAPNQQKTIQLPDGTAIRVRLNGALPQVTIVEPESETTETTDLATQWVPRGFVVYPAWHDKPFGVGLPVVQQGPDPYATTNLSPGVDPGRWTAGGPCGEVLVSADSQAGYPLPTYIPAPLLADATRGPQFMGDATNYDARKPDGAWTSYRLELAPFQAFYGNENPAVQQALFEQVNLARTGAGSVAATMRFRGYARVAEIAASIFVTAGSDADTSTSYPIAYASAADRLTKEGYTNDWTGSTAGFTRTDTGFSREYRAAGLSPTDAVAAWQSQPNSLLTANLASCVWMDVGFRGGYSVVAMAPRDRWIQAGNISWQSHDAGLPPISWHGFASLNLACETYPAIYGVSGANWVMQLDTSFTDTSGNCWLSYPRAAANMPYDIASSEPGMGRHIYSRGRSIALAPNGGLVWGACVQKVGANDRLIALIHHPADQSADALHEGFTRYLRVWWADIPPRSNGQRLAPQLAICGTDPKDPWAWQGGQLIDFGSMPPATNLTASAGPNSLMQTSQWRFATDGTRAVSLRSYSAYADYNVPTHNSIGTTWTYALGVTPTPARTVELLFDAAPATQNTPGRLDTQLVVHDFTSGVANQLADTPVNQSVQLPGPAGSPEMTVYDVGVTPLAVDYAGDSYQLMYACGGEYSGDGLDYSYVGTGTTETTFITGLHNVAQVGCSVRTATQSLVPSRTLVLDVQSGTFAVDGITAGACWPFTADDVHGVKLCRRGAVVSTDYYPIPDGSVVSYASLPTTYSPSPTMPANWGELLFCQSATIQGYYSTRFGEVVYGYQLMPLPYCVLALNAAPAGCAPTWQEALGTGTSHQMLGTEARPRGGKVVSTVPLPANDWLVFAKVV